MSTKTSEFATKQPLSKMYPNTYAFVRKYIVPHELSRINECVEVYLKRLLRAVKNTDNEYEGLNYLIFSISPFPSYIDEGASDFMNGSSHTLTTDSYIGEELVSALKSDNIPTNIPLGDEF
jgi:hypothetical protein